MEMFLMVATVSLLGMVVSIGLFAAATRENASPSELPVEQALPAAPPRFFLTDRVPAVTAVPAVSATTPRVPIEVLLLQIERHVRLEQAAAESFLDSPTIKSLHSRTTSPLVH